MTEQRKIAVVSGTRAEYGLLLWILRALDADPRATLQLIVTGSHLSTAFGRTVDAIRGDGFTIEDEIPIVLDDDDGWSTAVSSGLATIGIAHSLKRLAPDLLLLLGDRYEMLAAAQAAFLGRVPIVHLHGGEVTHGSLDDGMRHAITKLASLHLVSTEGHRQRVLQLGEPAERIHNVGAPGLESIARFTLENPVELEARIGCALGTPTVVVTYHPATLAQEHPTQTLDAIFDALEPYKDATIIATGSNADPGGRAIQEHLRRIAASFPGRLSLVVSLGQLGYLSAMSHADLVIGNSSSGIIEAPSLGVPTVNIGGRQAGRTRAPSVIDCSSDLVSIRAAIIRALAPEHRAIAAEKVNPYAGAGLAMSEHIVRLVLDADLEVLRGAKGFADLNPNTIV